MPTLQRSKIVQALADLASSGRYTVDPQGARNMTALYEVIATLINELESEEVLAAIPKEAPPKKTKAGGEIK